MILLATPGLSARGAAATPRPGIVVRFAEAGPHALAECAETLFRGRLDFATKTADGSDSLDSLQREIGVTGIRALFRRPDGRPLAEQATRLKTSLARGKSRSSGGSTGKKPADLPDLSHIYRVEIGLATKVEEAIARFANDPHVIWAQRDHRQRLDQLPDDPFLHSSGSWGQNYGDLWGLERIRAPEAWAISRGEGVVVAVVDTGLDYDHPDIAENVWVNPGEDLNHNGAVDDSDWNGIDDDGNGFIDDLRGFDFANSVDADQDGFYDGPDDVNDPDPFDDSGHGTHVSGTIAALADNGIGIAGVAPRARIMALKGFPAEGEGLDSVLWRAVLYAARHGAGVINNSWSCDPLCPDNPLAEEVIRTVHGMGAVVVTSAGNRSTDMFINSPENMRETLTVASTGEDDRPSATFTNRGWLLDVSAPGGGPSVAPNVYVARRNILSLRSSGDTDSAPFAVGDGYYRSAGTSMSAPHVSGVVALLLSAHPELDYESIRRAIRQGAVDLGPPGHDLHMGAGRLDALAALETLPLPDLDAAILSPRVGSVFRPGAPSEGPHERHSGEDDDDGGDREESEGEPENPPPGPPIIEIRGTAAGLDLADFNLSYGLGSEPALWHPIVAPSASEVRNGLLGRWDISDREQGAYLLRLEVRAVGGEIYREFLPLSLERNRFVAISEPGPPAQRPDISGRFVAWQSLRDGESPAAKADDSNLFASDFLGKKHWTIEIADGGQENVSITGPKRRPRRGARRPHAGKLLAVWHARPPEGGQKRAHACWLDPLRNLCPTLPVGPNSLSSMPPVAVAGHVFWIGVENGQQRLRACRPDPQGSECLEYDLGLEEGLPSFLSSDGRSLVWTQRVGFEQRAAVCEVDPASGACPARILPFAIAPLSGLTLSGRLLSWVEFVPRQGNSLMICEFDPESGECPTIEVANPVSDLSPALSGRRLVWDGSVGDQANDVFFCEFDAIRQRCPVQRLTAEWSDQHESTLDGSRVVWRDERQGSSRIFGIELPSLSPLRDRSVRGGRELRIPLRIRRPQQRGDATFALEVSIEEAGVSTPRDPRALGIRVESRDRGRGRLRWRPRRSHEGSYIFTISATTEAGLLTRQSLRVEVLPWPARPHRGGRHAGGRRGH